MHKHNSNCLDGPVLGSKEWWQEFGRDSILEQPMEYAADADSRPIRVELVERVRAEIAAGTYDTPAKWAMALDRLACEEF